MLKSILQNQGLTDKEIDIYICLLELGQQPASIIATKVGLARSGCYAVLSKLSHQGILIQIIKNNIRYFAVANPTSLLEKIKQQHTQEIKQIENLKNNLRINRSSPLPTNSKAHYYSGHAAIENLVAEVFSHPPTSASPTHPPSCPRLVLSTNSTFSKTHFLNLITKNPSVLNILSNELIPNPPPNYILRRLPKLFDLGVDVICNQNLLAIICHPENFAILIESPLITSSCSKAFDFVWNLSQKF